MRMSFQEKLQKLRKEKGLSQEKLAELMRGLPTGCVEMGVRAILSGHGEADRAE